MTLNRWTFLAIYLPLAALCWGIGHLAGVPDGTWKAVALGWGGGLVLTLLILRLIRRWRAGFRVEEWRTEAVQLRLTEPKLYREILSHADTDDPRVARGVANDPDAFVAIFLAAASDAGYGTAGATSSMKRSPRSSYAPRL